MKSYLIPKKYNYLYKYFENNKGIKFLKDQVEIVNTFNIELLKRYEEYLNSSSDNRIDRQVIVNDIRQFIFELNQAKSHLQKDYYKISKGFVGEEKVKNILLTYEDSWKVLRNTTLNINGNIVENDFIVISNGGVSIIEVKNIGNGMDSLKIDKYGRVARLNRFNKEVDSLDFITQNNRHMAYFNQYLKNLGYNNIPIYSYIVITSNIKIDNKSEFNVIGPNQLYSEINKQIDIISHEEIEHIYISTLKDILDEKSYPYFDYISVLEENYNIILKSIKEYIDDK